MRSSFSKILIALHLFLSVGQASGSKIVVGFPELPPSLLNYLAYNEMALAITQLVLEPLIELDRYTHTPIPRLAKSWKISADGKSLSFFLNPQAKFADGKPVRATDVLFTWKSIQNPAHKTPVARAFFSYLSHCEVIDPLTVRFHAHTKHFKNLLRFEEFFVLPEHLYANKDFNRDLNFSFEGSGPYRIEKASPDSPVYLKRQRSYWGSALKQNKRRYMLEEIVFKPIPDESVLFQAFQQGDVDYFYFLRSRRWVEDTKGPLFESGKIKKLLVKNALPFGTQGIAWNLRLPLFQDIRVRQALSHLMNRELWIRELFFNQYGLATGPVPHRSIYHARENKAIPYSPKKAAQLLKQAGWTLNTDGILTKGGQVLRFTLLIGDPGYQPVMSVYQSDLKKQGVEMKIRLVDGATAKKLSDERAFEAIALNWIRDIEPSDFAVQWGSAQADIPGSPNVTGYKNAEVDAWARELDESFDPKRRLVLSRKIDAAIGRDQPMSFTWEPQFFRIAYWDKFQFSPDYAPYDTWYSLFQYWEEKRPPA